jgi:hypothetical protein
MASGPLFDFGYISLDWAYDNPETNIMEAGATLILCGAYLGFLPEHYASPWVCRGRLRCILPEKSSYVAGFSSISRSERSNLTPMRQFIEDPRMSCAELSSRWFIVDGPTRLLEAIERK